MLPLKPGSPERQTHDYYRHGTTTLFAALDVLTGKVIGQCKQRHTAADFIAFLDKIRKQYDAYTTAAHNTKQGKASSAPSSSDGLSDSGNGHVASTTPPRSPNSYSFFLADPDPAGKPPSGDQPTVLLRPQGLAAL